jgi:serine O-acetyltransferase
LRDVPDDSTIVGVPGHIILRRGERVVITDPKQINDPLSEALAAVAMQVKDLKEKVQRLEGGEAIDKESAAALQSVIEMDYQI